MQDGFIKVQGSGTSTWNIFAVIWLAQGHNDTILKSCESSRLMVGLLVTDIHRKMSHLTQMARVTKAMQPPDLHDSNNINDLSYFKLLIITLYIIVPVQYN